MLGTVVVAVVAVVAVVVIVERQGGKFTAAVQTSERREQGQRCMLVGDVP
jgi:hypothetical protein